MNFLGINLSGAISVPTLTNKIIVTYQEYSACPVFAYCITQLSKHLWVTISNQYIIILEYLSPSNIGMTLESAHWKFQAHSFGSHICELQ